MRKMIKCSFIYVTTMNNNICYDLRTFLSLTTEKKTIHTGLCAVTFFRSWFSGTIGKWYLTFSKLHTLKQSLRPPPKCWHCLLWSIWLRQNSKIQSIFIKLSDDIYFIGVSIDGLYTISLGTETPIFLPSYLNWKETYSKTLRQPSLLHVLSNNFINGFYS